MSSANLKIWNRGSSN